MAQTFSSLWFVLWNGCAILGVTFVASEQLSALEEPIQHLKQQVTDQQQQLATLQREVARLLGEVKQNKQNLQGGGNGGAGAALSLTVTFPSPGKPAGTAIPEEEPSKRVILLCLSCARYEDAAKEEAAKGPIPIMSIKPTAIADVENAMMQTMEQDAAMTGQEVAEVNTPQPLIEKSPQQEMNEAIAAIDKLEALKTHYKYDIQNVQRNYAS